MLRFDPAEYALRLAKTKESMQEHGVDVLIVPDPANMNYLTGYDGWSFYVPQAVVVILDEEQPLWIGRYQDANAARATTYLEQRNIYAYPDVYVHADILHPMDYVANVVTERGLATRPIGVNMDAEYLSPRGLAALQNNLPDANFVDTGFLVNWVRAVKSQHELDYMDQAARIIEHVMQVAIDAVAPGVRQCDAVGKIYQAQMSGTEEFGGDYPAIAPLLPSGPGTNTPHLTWTDDPFRSDETTILELAACRHRYHVPMARTVHLGKAPKRLEETSKIVVEGIENALAAAKPGALCEEVELAWQRTIQRHGIVKESRIGYSVGLNYPPDWGEHTMSLRPGNKTEIRPNMCFHLIPGLWLEDWGVEISECFRVTEQGAQPFCNFPRQLVIKT